MIGFTLTEKQQVLRDAAVKIGKEILAPARNVYSRHHDQGARFQATLPFYQQLVKAGLVKAQIPVALGGSNESFLDSAITLEELYAVDSSLMVHVVGTGLGLLPLILGGTPEQQTKFLEPFLNCEGNPLASLTHSEPGGTANWLEKGGKGLGTTARKEDEYYIVNGEKVRSIDFNAPDFQSRADIRGTCSYGLPTVLVGMGRAQHFRASAADTLKTVGPKIPTSTQPLTS